MQLKDFLMMVYLSGPVIAFSRLVIFWNGKVFSAAKFTWIHFVLENAGWNLLFSKNKKHRKFISKLFLFLYFSFRKENQIAVVFNGEVIDRGHGHLGGLR